MKLFTFFQSGSSFRVRIALNLKEIDYEPVIRVISRESDDLRDPEYLKLNPSGVVPTLLDDGKVFNQSMAIIEYLEERYPQPSLLPADADGRARVRAIAQVIACDIHPLITVRVIRYMDDTLQIPPALKKAWLDHWNERGLGAVESMLADGATGDFCHGDGPTVADCYLVPQVITALRLGTDLSPFKKVNQIYDRCMALPAFQQAAPENQPDAPAT